MKALLLFLNSIFAFFCFSLQAETIPTDSLPEQSRRYSFQIETPKAFLSGIFIAKDNDGKISGSMVNEFGVSAIDFIYDIDKDKLDLVNVIGFLDKWYIKRVLKKDIKFCIHILFETPFKGQQNYIVEQNTDDTTIINDKNHLKYTFTPLDLNPQHNETAE